MTRAICLALGAMLGGGAALAAQTVDSSTYADARTREVVSLARARHVLADSTVLSYTARVTTRIEASAGKSRFARAFPLIAHETAARIAWSLPNDLQVHLLGVRVASPFSGVRPDVWLDRPWFIPRSPDDTVRLMGVPSTAALHPLADGAEQWYRYRIVDSLLMAIPGRTIRAIGVRVEPKRPGPSLMAGEMWIDAESGDLVRLMVTFVGEYVWSEPDSGTAVDSAEARKRSRKAEHYLTVNADLQYALIEGRYWMPSRQLLAVTLDIPWLGGANFPMRALTTFSDYDVNGANAVAFELPVDSGAHRRRRCGTSDSLVADSAMHGSDWDRCERAGFAHAGRWNGGQWEVDAPPLDTLRAYHWATPLTLTFDAADAAYVRATVGDLARLDESLPDAWMGRETAGLRWRRLADLVRFNRVQGLSVGLGYQVRPGPDFTTLQGTVRFGLSDHRPTGALAWIRDAPSGHLEITGFREYREFEPWSEGASLANSINALFAGHDDADYLLASGGAVSYTPYVGALHEVTFLAGIEHQATVKTTTGSRLNDWLGGSGVLGPNPSVTPGNFARLAVEPHARLGALDVRPGAEALFNDSLHAARVWLATQLSMTVAGRRAVLRVKGGAVLGDSLPQMRYGVGGPESVRGYDYGTEVGHSFWSAQLDVPLTRGWLATPVVFGDVGGTFSDGDPLVGAGAGLSFLNGWFRLDVSKGLRPARDVRFDLRFAAPR